MIDNDFKKFIDINCNRIDFIQKYLFLNDIESYIFPIDGKKHIYVQFPLKQYNSLFKIKTVIAHYDRVENSPGANDNSAAVFCMLKWAVRLSKLNTFHNIRLIFTDGEELGSEGVKSQGAFALAELFRKLEIVSDDVYVFDCVGRGTVPVICQSLHKEKTPPQFQKEYDELEERAERIIKNVSGGKWFKLPSSYSDNAGFIANGIPAVALTMLPSEEIDNYYNFLLDARKYKQDYFKNNKSINYQTLLPQTWKILHTMDDNYESLTPEAFDITGRILDNLAELKTVVSKSR